MNRGSGRCSWSSAAARTIVLLALFVGACGKRDESPSSAAPQSRTVSDASGAIGRIHALEGDVRIAGARGEERAQAGVVIDRGESVRTLPNAWALIAMTDGATITVRADSELRFDDYRYDADGDPQHNTASVSLVRGALRSITGLIGQSNPAGYQVRTPSATIGIRGTDHEPAYYPPPPPGEKAAHPPGTYDKVNTGETVIRRPAGEVAVRRGQTAYAPVEVKAPPQLLQNAPAFYQRHAEVDRRVVDRREEFARQFTEQQQRRQQDRERQRQLMDQKQRDDAKNRLDDRKKQRDERQKQQDALKKKQDEQRRDREKKQDELKKKQEAQKLEREKKRDELEKRQEAQKREREKKQAAQTKKQEEDRRERDKKREERRGMQDEPEKGTARAREQQKDARQQQLQERQQQQQLQREQRQQQQQQRQQQQQQQRQMQQQERLREQTQRQQQQAERQRQRAPQQQERQGQQQPRQQRGDQR